MSPLHAGHLLAQVHDVGAIGIGHSRGDVAAVIDCVYPRKNVATGDGAIDASGAEVFTNCLRRAAEYLRDAIEIRRGGRRSHRSSSG